MTNTRRAAPFLLCGALGLACGDDGKSTGSATDITLDKDPSISSAGDGYHGSLDFTIEPGDGAFGHGSGPGLTDLVDGYTVRYSKFLVTLGEFSARLPSAYAPPDPYIRHEGAHVIDLLAGFPAGALLFRLDGVPQGDYAEFDVSMLSASAATEAWNGGDEDLELMRTGGYAIYVEGTVTGPRGRPCNSGAPKDCLGLPARTVRFRWGIPVETYYQGCAGFSVEYERTTDVRWTIPADRWFHARFSHFGASAPRRARWVVEADLDGDGETTLAELKAIDAAALLTPELGYDLTGAPIAIGTAYDFLVAHVHAMGLGGASGCARATAAN